MSPKGITATYSMSIRKPISSLQGDGLASRDIEIHKILNDKVEMNHFQVIKLSLLQDKLKILKIFLEFTFNLDFRVKECKCGGR